MDLHQGMDVGQDPDFGEILDDLYDFEEEEFYESDTCMKMGVEEEMDFTSESDTFMTMEAEEEMDFTSDEELTASLEMEMPIENAKEKRGRPTGWRKEKEDVTIIRPRQKRKEKNEPMPIAELCYYICCATLCLASTSLEIADKARRRFQELTLTEKSNWILQWLKDHSRYENGKLLSTFSIGGKNVCLMAWRTILHIPRSTFYAILNRYKKGHTCIGGPGNICGRMGSSAQEAMGWLFQFAADHADKLPDSTKLHLPSCLTKLSVYNMYKENSDSNILSLTHFLKLWRETMTHIVIPKRSRFSQCDVCTMIKNKLMVVKTKAEKKTLMEYRNEHLRIQNAERRKYYKHSSKAKKNPDKYLSLIIDAMDQRKTAVPNFYTESKSLANTYRLRVNLMAVVAHGIGIYGYFDAFQWSHGSCYTLSVLAHTLTMLEFIPDILYLQMDNCYGQNKNKYTLGFLARLIEEKIFKKVKLSFLLVGHTHEDVDQVFSRFSVWIGQNTVLTMDELMKGFETCYRPRPTAIKMHTVYNFQRWLGVNNVKNHSKPHVFKITLNEKTGKAEVQYKGLSTDKDWIKPGGDGLLLEEGQRQLYTIPSTTDNIDIEKLKTDLTTVYRYYNAEDLKSWWDGYINELYEDEELETTEVQLVEILRQKKINQKSPEEENEVSNTDDAINLPTLKPEIPKVIIGKADRKAAQAIKEVETFEIGSFVICNYDKYPDEFPQLARVISVSDENLELLWYKGAKTTTWKPASRPVKGQRGQREPWTEIVPSIAVMFYDFQLTPLGKLPQHIKEVLDQL